jgi:hypothetical protein
VTLHRPESLLIAFYAVVLGICPPVFWPTDPQNASVVRYAFWFAAVVYLFAARTPRERTAPASTIVRWSHRAAWALGGAFGLVVVAWMHACAYLVVALLSVPLAISVGVFEFVALSVCAWAAWRRPSARPAVKGVVATVLCLGCMQFVGFAAWVWSPPASETCEALIRPGTVDRLTPAHWPQENSQPFSLLYIPEEGWLVAAYKMAGNGGFFFWNTPSANRVWGVDLDDPSSWAEVPLGAEKTPLHLTYEPDTRQLLVGRQGPGEHALSLVSLTELPAMSLVQTIAYPYAPHKLATQLNHEHFGVLTEHGRFGVLAVDGLKESRSIELTIPGDHQAVPLYAWHAPGTSKFYVSLLLYPLAEIDMTTLEVRWTDIQFGGGHVLGLEGHPEIFHTDMLTKRLDVISREDLTLTRRLDLDYTPRALALDQTRDLLMLGSWFDGEVHFYRLSTLQPLGVSVTVGPGLRDLVFEPERGLLFSGSTCGVYRVPVDSLLQAHAR